MDFVYLGLGAGCFALTWSLIRLAQVLSGGVT